MTAARDLDACPYVGLQPFLEEHREYFFGREKDQRLIIANVLASPLTAAVCAVTGEITDPRAFLQREAA